MGEHFDKNFKLSVKKSEEFYVEISVITSEPNSKKTTKSLKVASPEWNGTFKFYLLTSAG